MDFLGIQKESPAEKQVKALLFDDGVQVLSTFELNQVASLTYGDLVCDQIFEIIENVVAQPMNYTPLSVQKSLVITKHILIYGAEKCVNSGYGISKFIESLTEFNTVLMAQKQSGAMAIFQRIQGGGVDRGGPVREVATDVCRLLANINQLRQIRNANASPNSLVPIGDDSVGFVSDEVRLMVLKKRIEEEHRIRLQSNLAKSEGSFGGGYNSRDGNVVVGAAHGIEEMIKMAKKETSKYSDDSRGYVSRDAALLAELEAESQAAKAVDLLGSDNPASNERTPQQPPGTEVDLLDFGATVDASSNLVTPAGDLLGQTDLLGISESSRNQMTLSAPNHLLGIGVMQQSVNHLSEIPGSVGLLGAGQAIEPTVSTQSLDPFASLGGVANSSSGAQATYPAMLLGTAGSISDLPSSALSNPTEKADLALSGMTLQMSGIGLSGNQGKNPIMGGSSQDRFAALDALTPAGASALTNVKNGGMVITDSPLDGLAAMHVMGTGGERGTNENEMKYSATGDSAVLPSMTYPPSTLPPPPHERPTPAGVGQIGETYGGSPDDADNPFVMGGLPGAGLEPVAPAPGAPPPPPPPSS